MLHLTVLLLAFIQSQATSADRSAFHKHLVVGGDSRDDLPTEIEWEKIINIESPKPRINLLDNEEDIVVSPTEMARQRGILVTNSRDSFSGFPIEPFTFIISPVKREIVKDVEKFRPSIEKALTEQFQRTIYDSYISFDSLELAEITAAIIPTNNRALLEEKGEMEQVAVTIEGGKANFNIWLDSPTSTEISSIVKDCVESDSFLQTLKDTGEFSGVEKLEFMQGKYVPVVPNDPPPNSEPKDEDPPLKDKDPVLPSPNIGVVHQQLASAKAEESFSPSSLMMVSSVSLTAILITLASALFLRKHRSNKKEWSTENHDPNISPFNLASMDSQQIYNTGIVSLGEKSNLDDDFLHHSNKIRQQSQTNKCQHTSERSVSEYSADLSLRDNILEMTRSIFINFSSENKTNNINHSTTAGQRRNCMTALEEKGDITSQTSTQETSTYDMECQDLSSRSYIPELDRPPPISIRMTSASSSAFNDDTASREFDLEPDMSWDPNDNDVDSDAASIDAPFVLT